MYEDLHGDPFDDPDRGAPVVDADPSPWEVPRPAPASRWRDRRTAASAPAWDESVETPTPPRRQFSRARLLRTLVTWGVVGGTGVTCGAVTALQGSRALQGINPLAPLDQLGHAVTYTEDQVRQLVQQAFAEGRKDFAATLKVIDDVTLDEAVSIVVAIRTALVTVVLPVATLAAVLTAGSLQPAIQALTAVRQAAQFFGQDLKIVDQVIAMLQSIQRQLVQSPATLKQLVQVDSIHAFQFLAGVKQRVDAALAPATPTIAPGGVPHPTTTPPPV
jgi:hypothetical protein